MFSIAAGKRWLIRLHRWLGLGLWLFFCSWFASGIVMMYAGYPELTEARRIALLPPLDLTSCCITLDSAVRGAKLASALRHARIEMLADRPVYHLEDSAGQRALVAADDGTPIDRVPVSVAQRVIAQTTESVIDTARTTILSEPDQWVLETSHGLFPLARFHISDSARTLAYLSLESGEIVQLVTRRQRLLAWFGAIPHWIYPASLRRHRDGWRYLVLVLAALGMIGSATGLTIGFWRARRRGLSVWLRSPYPNRWLRWHHYLGLSFGLFAFTWVFSGLLSLNPFDWSPGNGSSAAEAAAIAGGSIQAAVATRPRDALARLPSTFKARQLAITRVGGKTFYVATTRSSSARIVSADQTGTTTRDRFTLGELVAAFEPIARITSPKDIAELTSYDDYYYSRDGSRPLPVLRIESVSGRTYYIDVHRGSIVYASTMRSRLERWLYHGLHSLDFAALVRHPPLWDLAVVGLSLGGLALSVSGAVLAVRWLRAPNVGTRH